MNVTFCGNQHVTEPEKIIKWLNDILPVLIESGADNFFLGSCGDFDYLAALALKVQKKNYKKIKLILVLGCRNKKFEMSLYDHVVYPPMEQENSCMMAVKCGRLMVDRSDLLVSGVINNDDDSAHILAYAKKKGKTILQYPFYSTE